MIRGKGMEMILARGNHDWEGTVKKYMKQKKELLFSRSLRLENRGH